MIGIGSCVLCAHHIIFTEETVSTRIENERFFQKLQQQFTITANDEEKNREYFS